MGPNVFEQILSSWSTVSFRFYVKTCEQPSFLQNGILHPSRDVILEEVKNFHIGLVYPQ